MGSVGRGERVKIAVFLALFTLSNAAYSLELIVDGLPTARMDAGTHDIRLPEGVHTVLLGDKRMLILVSRHGKPLTIRSGDVTVRIKG